MSLGLNAGLSTPISVSDSDIGPIQNGVETRAAFTADGGAGLVGVSKEIAKIGEGGTVTLTGAGNGASGGVNTGVADVKIKPALKAGASVGLHFEATATTSIVADTINAVNNVIYDVNNKLKDCAFSASC